MLLIAQIVRNRLTVTTQYRIELSNEAQDDIVDIGRYTLERHGIQQMDKYLNSIDEAINLIQENPNIGRFHQELPEEYKVWRMNEHLIIFLIQDEIISIARVVHVKLDLKFAL